LPSWNHILTSDGVAASAGAIQKNNTFLVTLGNYLINMTSILSNGILDPATKLYQQRIFEFHTTYTIIFHVPIAGVSINYKGDSTTWKGRNGTVDMWQYKNWSLGVLDKNSWVRNQDSTVSVHYVRGDNCGPLYSPRSTTLTFGCGTTSYYKYSFFEGPVCRCKLFLVKIVLHDF